jgi:dihydroorotase
MAQSYLIQNIQIVNEGQIQTADILVEDGLIAKIGENLNSTDCAIIDGSGKFLLPGVIDGQVHFRDPGLTHKADVSSESKAAIAGGITSYIDMPNTRPNVLSQKVLDAKYENAKGRSWANYCFLLGVNGSNIDDVIAMDTSNHLAVTDDGLYFSDKGNILADQPEMLEKLFANCKSIVAIHSELESVIDANEEKFREKYGEDVPVKLHPVIRSEDACYDATKRAIELAKKHNARLHILHLTTAKETGLFRNDIPLEEKRITTEVCVQHMWFNDTDYERLGTRIKWNPAIKSKKDNDGLLAALLDDRIDFITTDHAPHAWEEKNQTYFKAMSGAPMVQHALPAMLEFHLNGKIPLEKLVEKMCHNPARFYQIEKRGYVREGYFADLTIVDTNKPWTVAKDNILYKCGWSPMEGQTFRASITHTFVNGDLAYDNGNFSDKAAGQPLEKAT